MRKLILPCAAALALMACQNEAVEEEGVGTDVAEVDTGAEGIGVEGQQTAGQPLSWDADNDTLIDENEFTGFGDQGFAGWDGDGDDSIGMPEFERGWTEAGFNNPQEAFTRFDANNDQRLERNEFFTQDQFATWDANNNDVLEREEFAYYRA